MTLLFWDESGFCLEPSVTRTWSPKGQTPLLRARRERRQRLDSIGLLAYSPQQGRVRALFRFQQGSVDPPFIIDTLRALRRHLRGPVILLWDGLSAHRAALTKTYLASQAHWLQAERLPAYAPELNPVEQMWANLTRQELANLCPDTLPELAQQTEHGMARISNSAQLLCGFLRHSGLFPELSP